MRAAGRSCVPGGARCSRARGRDGASEPDRSGGASTDRRSRRRRRRSRHRHRRTKRRDDVQNGVILGLRLGEERRDGARDDEVPEVVGVQVHRVVEGGGEAASDRGLAGAGRTREHDDATGHARRLRGRRVPRTVCHDAGVMERADAELQRLRARAYGPGADIRDDSLALQRLSELENLRRADASTPAPPADDAPPARDGRGDPSRSPRDLDLRGLAGARGHRPPIAETPTPTAREMDRAPLGGIPGRGGARGRGDRDIPRASRTSAGRRPAHRHPARAARLRMAAVPR